MTTTPILPPADLMPNHKGWRSLLPSANALILVLLINLFVLVLGGAALLDSYHQAQDKAIRSAQDLSQVLAENMNGLIDRLDFALLAMTDEVRQPTQPTKAAEKNNDPTAIQSLISGWRMRLPGVEDFWITDETGRVRYGTRDVRGLSEYSLGDRNYFQELRNDPTPRLIISKPVVGRITQQWIIILARRIDTPDGRFAGIAIASLPVSNLVQMFSALHLGKDGAISLRAADLSVMARYPETVGKASAVGKTAVSAELIEAVQANPEMGNYVAKAGIDGIERSLSYHRVGDHPLYVMVGLALSDTLADWRHGAHPLIAGMVAFVLLTIAGGVVISRIWNDREDAFSRLQSLMNEQERFAEILTHHLQEPVRIQHIFAQRLRGQLPQPLSPDLETTLEHLQRGASRLRALLRDVRSYLTLDDLDEGEQCDAEAVLGHVIRRLNGKIQAVQAEIVHTNLPLAPIGEKSLALIWDALLDNALTYRIKGKPPLIEIQGSRYKGWVIYTITDNGRGIPDEFREKVFHVFERLTPQEDQSGTGIGLAIVRKIMNRVNGSVILDAAETGGTRVTLTFPA